MHMRGNSYRGPRGHLLICETPIAGSRWQHHGVDISEQGSLPLMGMGPFRTGDAAFDRRFTAWQDGVPVREGWLDAATRGAVAAFFDTTPLSGSLWVRAGMLQYSRHRAERDGSGRPARCTAHASRRGAGLRAHRRHARSGGVRLTCEWSQ